MIDDNASGTGDPDVTEVIEAGGLESIFEIDYLAGRSFQLKNKGTVDLSWGLSDADNAATNPLLSIAAGASSTKLSSTLAPSGKFLLVKNTTTSDATVELTVLE